MARPRREPRRAEAPELRPRPGPPPLAVPGGERTLAQVLSDLGRASYRLASHVPDWAFVLLAGFVTLLCAMLTRERRRARRAVEEALRDPLTGLANRLAFDHRAALEWARAKRHDRGLGVIVLDLDGFKGVNDRGGHAAGDRVLKNVGQALERRARRSDLVARLGGDEFVMLAPETDSRGLSTLVEGVAQVIAAIGVEVSVGSAERRAGDLAFDEVLERADFEMYAHKPGASAKHRLRAGDREAGPAAVGGGAGIDRGAAVARIAGTPRL